MTTAIWWIRRDLRLTDNQALTAATKHADQVIPVFVLDPALLTSPYTGEKRRAFLLEGLHQLAADLRDRGGQLIVRQGAPDVVLARLTEESGATAIFAEADYSPYARQRDEKIATSLPLHLCGGLTVHPPQTVLKSDDTPYVVFTPYSRTWKSLPPPGPDDILPAPVRLSTPAGLVSEPLPSEPDCPASVAFSAGEAEAQRRLVRFTGKDSGRPPLYCYAHHRNRMDLDGTSKLSPYLRLGMISSRQLAVTTQQAWRAVPHAEAEKGVKSWYNELIWREFYISILYHFPHVRQSNFKSRFDNFPWLNAEADFLAWRQGQTGYPIVDAAMRQLVQSGWMHNRTRMIVASFLVKHLLIDWRWGEKFFMQHLLDGDPAANNGGWQWAAGSGTDAAPFFRIFNPILQSKKFDPDGVYIRRWVPELATIPDEYIHTPWELPPLFQREVGCVIGQDYPAPVVDHGMARDRALAAYNEIRGR